MQRTALAKRPIEAPHKDNFRLESIEIPALGENDVIPETEYMSFDPNMCGRTDDSKFYAAPVPVGVQWKFTLWVG